MCMSSPVTQTTPAGTPRGSQREREQTFHFSNFPSRLAQSGFLPAVRSQPSVRTICPLCPLTFLQLARSGQRGLAGGLEFSLKERLHNVELIFEVCFFPNPRVLQPPAKKT